MKKLVLIIQRTIMAVMFGLSFNLMFAPALVAAAPVDTPAQAACRGVALTDAEAKKCDDPNDMSAETTVGATMRKVIDLISIVVGIIAVIMVIVSGLKYITSGGDSSKVSSAKDSLLYALIGLGVVGVAQILVRFVINNLPG